MERVKLFPASQRKIRSLKLLYLVGTALGTFPEFSSGFRWISWSFFNMFINLCLIIYHTVMSLLSTTLENGLDLFELVIPNIIALTAWFLFLKVAIAWSVVTENWKRIEDIMNMKYGYPKIIDKINWIVIVFSILFGLADLILYDIDAYKDMSQELGSNFTWETFARTEMLFNMSYHHALVGLHIVFKFKAGLAYMFIDTFIIMICVAVAMRFKQITTFVKMYKTGANKTVSWRKIRTDYCLLADLVYLLDDKLCELIILAYGLNAFHLLQELTDHLININRGFAKASTTYNTVFAVVRLIAITLFAAWINDESKEPAKILNSLEPEEYNNGEVRRWLLQIKFDEITLTGWRLFKLNRRLVLDVIGAIVTYELIIIQYKLGG